MIEIHDYRNGEFGQEAILHSIAFGFGESSRTLLWLYEVHAKTNTYTVRVARFDNRTCQAWWAQRLQEQLWQDWDTFELDRAEGARRVIVGVSRQRLQKLMNTALPTFAFRWKDD